jgi:hypothetical protein
MLITSRALTTLQPSLVPCTCKHYSTQSFLFFFCSILRTAAQHTHAKQEAPHSSSHARPLPASLNSSDSSAPQPDGALPLVPRRAACLHALHCCLAPRTLHASPQHHRRCRARVHAAVLSATRPHGQPDTSPCGPQPPLLCSCELACANHRPTASPLTSGL